MRATFAFAGLAPGVTITTRATTGTSAYRITVLSFPSHGNILRNILRQPACLTYSLRRKARDDYEQGVE